ncbi:hypothetical protein ACFQ15_18835 [Sphingomonas hankookensis]|uniref:hypothetical protein n=1 Tax=Sphingomonas hankookensis TaxID=563996 RepID=UPI001F5AFBC1|nr:hypothetical protein [Sphingomonas hankookensis]
MSSDTVSPAIANLRSTLGVVPTDPALAGADDATRLLCWMLAATRPWPAAASDVMEALFTAHRDGEGDDAIWSTLRRRAIDLSEHADADVGLHGRVAEAAAWPLATARAGLVELLHAICAVRAHQASLANGWSAADEAAAHTILSAIAEGDGVTKPARDDIPALFRTTDPALERRFAFNLHTVNTAYLGFQREVAAWLAGAAR